VLLLGVCSSIHYGTWLYKNVPSEFIGESPSGKAPDFDSGIRRFDPYLPSQFVRAGLMLRS
jgi:hypothetical protein